MSAVDPALLVAVPLVGSVLPVLVGLVDDRRAWPAAAVVLLAHAAVVVAVAGPAAVGAAITGPVGGIPRAYAIVLVVDRLSAPFLLLTGLTGLGAVLVARRTGPRDGLSLGLLCLLVAGVTGVALTGDVFNLYVFLEISGLAAYALVARGAGGPAALAALRYLLAGTVGATLYLLGVGYLYLTTGTLRMAALPEALAAGPGLDGVLTLAAFGLVVAGLAVKVALFPVHVWKPAAYRWAPTVVAATLATLVSTVAAYAVLRLLLVAFGPALLLAVPTAGDALVAAGVVSVLAGTVLAVREPDVRRLLAYSSVAQFGVVVVGVGVATQTALAGAVLQLVGHAVTKGGAYLLAGALAARYGATTVTDYAGLAQRAPWAAVALGVLALSLIGIPPTVGFAGKLYILVGAIEADAAVAAAVVLASTLGSLVYLGRLLGRVFVHEPPADTGEGAGVAPGSSPTPDGGLPRHADGTALWAVVAVTAVLAVGLGLVAEPVVDLLGPALEGVDSEVAG